MDGVLLAAGSSVRFGGNKLLYEIRGKRVYRYVLELLYGKMKEGLLEHVIVVSQYDEIFDEIGRDFPGVEAVRNPEPEAGISGSVRLGLERLGEVSPGSLGCLFAVADQPGLTGESVERLVRFWQRHSYGIVAACHEGQPGNPVIFSSAYYGELRSLEGDRGGKVVLRRHMEDVGLCEIPAKELEDMDMQEDIVRVAFPFLREQGHVISLVGAGGKTTLMNAIAHVYGSQGRKVLITTTTHIMRPKDCPVAESMEEVRRLFKDHVIVAAGTRAQEGKLQRPLWLDVEECKRLAEAVMIEADGAKHFPCKVPADKEPVILAESDIVLGVLGMDAVGRPLGQVCFRKEQAMRLLGADENHVMEPEDMVRILTSDWGTRKAVGHRDYWVVLNKCGSTTGGEQAKRIEELLAAAGFDREKLVKLP